MAKYVYEGDDKISIDRSCRTCKFNFPAEQIDVIDKKTGKKGYKDSKEKICAGQNRDLEYGQRIKDFKAERKCWDPSMEYLMNLSRRLQKKNNPYLVVKVEALLEFDFNLKTNQKEIDREIEELKQAWERQNEKKKYRECPYCKRNILNYLKGCPYCGKEIKETLKKKKPVRIDYNQFFKKLSRIKKGINWHDNKNKS